MDGHQSSKFSLWFAMDLDVCLIEWYQVRRHICWSFTKQQPCIATRSPHQTSSLSHLFNSVVMNQHTCLLTRHRDSSHLCRLHRTTNTVCCNCTWLTGMLGTVALEQQACLFKLHPASVHVCYWHKTISPVIIATGSADIFNITHVWLCDTGLEHMSETKQLFSVTSLTRLAGLPCYCPPCYCCHLGRHLEYFKTQKTTTICQSNFPNTPTVENCRKIVFNCQQV